MLFFSLLALAQSPHVCAHEDMCTVDKECGQGRSCVDYGDHKCCSDATNETQVHVCAPSDTCTKDSECKHGSTCVNYGDHHCCTLSSPSAHTCPHDMCTSNADCGGHGTYCQTYGDHGCCEGGHGGHWQTGALHPLLNVLHYVYMYSILRRFLFFKI